MWAPPVIQSLGSDGVFGQKDGGSGGQLEGTWEGGLVVPERTGGSRLGKGRSEAGKTQVRGSPLRACPSVCPPPAVTAASLTFGAGTSADPSPSLWPRLL